ncbi:hypothetical protein B4U80_12748 [Leptotrombidium deliense]|uniref:Uncharacterized protein n=1 Tax=Leptotrombidium deliense TaxID=299467 RepID=A0A443SNG9_9ACAR|nr:hypothetical protein B4U80_12748 [Leptotrombidium deliense]
MTTGYPHIDVVIASLHNKLGLKYFEDLKFEKALKCYNDAINLDSSNIEYYENRVNCFIELWSYDNAISDATQISTLEELSVKSYELQLKCHLIFGKFLQASICYENMLEECGESEITLSFAETLEQVSTLDDEWKQSIQEEKYNEALTAISDLNDIAYRSTHHRLIEASVLYKLQDYLQSFKCAKSVLFVEPRNQQALIVVEKCQIEYAAIYALYQLLNIEFPSEIL